MQLSDQERAHNREAFRAMTPGQKAQYVFAYYKLPLVLALVAVVALVSVARYFLTHKESVLYVAYANVVVDDQLDQDLATGFVRELGQSENTHEVYRYQDLYLSNNASTAEHEYAYASKLKVMAATDAQELDMVLMNQESWDLLSNAGYLLDLDEALGSADDSMRAALQPYLATNVVVLEDNAIEVELNEAQEYQAQTMEVANALDATDFSAFRKLNFSDRIYLGVIGNSPRVGTALQYACYLMDEFHLGG